jgi:putative Ca2+/H+ antiporter (TMEM165/GDT1 family)
MDLITIFLTTFSLIFIGELGDKTQFAAGTGALSNRKKVLIIFFSSAMALIAVASITVLFAGLIPNEYIPTIKKFGGGALILYGICLYYGDEGPEEEEDLVGKNDFVLFVSHFSVVFIAELGDKTQMITLGSALENQSHLYLVFTASASALVTVTALTVWGVTKIPTRWIQKVRLFGILGMMGYGLYIIVS